MDTRFTGFVSKDPTLPLKNTSNELLKFGQFGQAMVEYDWVVVGNRSCTKKLVPNLRIKESSIS